MKYLLLLLFPLQTFAQQWVFPGSQWTYHVYGWTGESLLYLNYEKDTVLSAQSCAKLRATLIKATHIGPDVYQIDSIYPESIYTYSQNDTVFFWRATSFFPAYFFNLNTGDTLSYFHVYNSTCSPDDSIVKIRIDTAGTFQHDGYSLRYYVGKPIGDVATTWGQSSIKVLERIGVLEYFIDPYFLCLTDYDTYSLRCYKDDAFGTYQNTATDCDYLVSIKNEPDDLPVRIFPNPASTDVMIDYGFTDWSKSSPLTSGGGINPSEVSMEIVNELGQVVHQQILPRYSSFQKINVSGFASGGYHVFIRCGTRTVAVGRFVKEL